MKKSFIAIMALIMAILPCVAKNSDGKNTLLYRVEMDTEFPIGEIKSDGIEFNRKPVKIVGYLEVVTGSLIDGGKKNITEEEMQKAPKYITATFYYMTSESIRFLEKNAIRINELNRATGGRSRYTMSYTSYKDVTSSFSCVGERTTQGGMCFSFNILRPTYTNTRSGDELINIPSPGHFGYGIETVNFTISAVGNGDGTYFNKAEGVATLITDQVPKDVTKYLHTFKGLQELNNTGNKMRLNGVATFKAERVPWFANFKEDLESYFYNHYDYSDVEVLDRVKDYRILRPLMP